MNKIRSAFLALSILGGMSLVAAHAASITIGYRLDTNYDDLPGADRTVLDGNLKEVIWSVQLRCLDDLSIKTDDANELSYTWVWEGDVFDSNVVYTAEAKMAQLNEADGAVLFIETEGTGSATNGMSFEHVNFGLLTLFEVTSRGLASGNGVLVAIRSDSESPAFVYMRTTDGVHWEEHSNSAHPVLETIFFLHDRFYAIAEDATGTTKFFHSTDALDWEPVVGDHLPGTYVDSAYGEGVYFIQTFRGNPMPPIQAIYSTDGVSWDSASVMPVQTGVAYADGLFVATGVRTLHGGVLEQRVFVSEDGIDWNETSAASSDIPGIVDFVHQRSEVVSFNGEFFTSLPDWKTGRLFQAGDLIFVADGGLYYSADAYDILQKADIGDHDSVSAVEYAFGKYWVITGSGSLLVADYSGTGESGHSGCERTQWAGYAVQANHLVDTLGWIGWIYLGEAGWTFNYNLNDWVYLPEEFVTEGGSWAYVPR